MAKYEYVLSIRLSKLQMLLYEQYLEQERHTSGASTMGKGGRLFSDYQYLMRIWTHPWVLKLEHIRSENKVNKATFSFCFYYYKYNLSNIGRSC